MITKPNIEVLRKLQDSFVCEKCGNCCKVGGDMVMCSESVERLVSARDDINCDDIAQCLEVVSNDPDRFRFVDHHPCMFYDTVQRICRIHEFKPVECLNFPFLLLAEGGTSFDSLLLCPGAQNALADYFGVPHGNVRIRVF